MCLAEQPPEDNHSVTPGSHQSVTCQDRRDFADGSENRERVMNYSGGPSVIMGALNSKDVYSASGRSKTVEGEDAEIQRVKVT